jgi:hypothetical protein
MGDEALQNSCKGGADLDISDMADDHAHIDPSTIDEAREWCEYTGGWCDDQSFCHEEMLALVYGTRRR